MLCAEEEGGKNFHIMAFILFPGTFEEEEEIISPPLENWENKYFAVSFCFYQNSMAGRLEKLHDQYIGKKTSL